MNDALVLLFCSISPECKDSIFSCWGNARTLQLSLEISGDKRNFKIDFYSGCPNPVLVDNILFFFGGVSTGGTTVIFNTARNHVFVSHLEMIKIPVALSCRILDIRIPITLQGGKQ